MSNHAPRRILVTGASRGIGLEFCRQWAEAGRTVFALARDPAAEGLAALAAAHPDQVHPVACDVGDSGSVAAAAQAVAAATDALDLVVNNAGIYGRQRAGIRELQVDKLDSTYNINALGPLRVTQALLKLLENGEQPRVVHLTSLMGSLADNGSGGSYAYRMSKAALNMASVNLAHDLGGAGIVSAVIHPGWVQTDMGGAHAPLALTDAVAAMVRTIEGLGPDANGSFCDREGKPLPW